MTSPADPPRPPEGALPCPWCGFESKAVSCADNLDDEPPYAVECQSVWTTDTTCAMGPRRATPEEAVVEWNRVAALRASAERAVRLEKALRDYDNWASSMPDAGFNATSPRWQWWYRRPDTAARAALEGGGRG